MNATITKVRADGTRIDVPVLSVVAHAASKTAPRSVTVTPSHAISLAAGDHVSVRLAP